MGSEIGLTRVGCTILDLQAQERLARCVRGDQQVARSVERRCRARQLPVDFRDQVGQRRRRIDIHGLRKGRSVGIRPADLDRITRLIGRRVGIERVQQVGRLGW